MPSSDAAPDIPDEYLTEIGRVTTRWAILEGVLDLCLAKLTGKEITDPRSLIIFNHMAFPMKLDVLGALVSELLPGYPKLSAFPSVHQKLKQAQEKRNLIAHSRWGVHPETGQIEYSRLTARGKLKTSVTPISLDEVKAAAESVTDAAQALYLLVIEAGTTNKPPQAGQ